MKIEETITRGKLLDDMKEMLYLKLVELHIALANENFSSVNVDTGQTITTFTPKLELLSATKDTLMSLQLLGCGGPLLSEEERGLFLFVNDDKEDLD